MVFLWLLMASKLDDRIQYHVTKLDKFVDFIKFLRFLMLYKQPECTVKYEKFVRKDYLPIENPGFSTRSIHVGQQPEPIHGSVNVPIHMSSTFAQRDIAEPFGKFDYTRGGNPTREALEKCMASLEGGKHCIAYSSGCGATASIMHILSSGDHIVVCDDVYGGTQRYIRLFAEKNFKVQAEFVDMTSVPAVEKALKKDTKLVWIETPTNPTMKLVDIAEVVKAVRKESPEAVIVADNTFASAFLQSPLDLGVDIVYHSCSKYMGGHSDVIMGAIILNNEELHKKIFLAAASIGVNPSPFDCYLVLRGIKTLEARVTQSTCNAFHIAHYMETRPEVESIMYPGLKSNSQHEIAQKQMRGFGGMISFRVKGGKAQVSKFLKSIKVFLLAESLGGVESLAQCPAFMTHASVPAEKREKLGITDNLIRLSAGIESTDDLIMDIDQALKASQVE